MSSSSSATSLFKPMAESCVLSSSSPSLFTAKTPYPFLSFPSKVIRLHLSSAFSLPSLSLKKKKNIAHSPSSSIITLVAQTSDWAQQEDNTLTIDREEEPSWEAEGEDSVAASNEGGEEEEGYYAEPPEDAKLFVGNLPYDIDSDKLAQIFEKAGTVEIAEVIYNRETDQSRGFGFVTLSTVEEAEKAVDIFSRYELNGRQLTVNKAAPRGAREERPPRVFEPAFRIYVGNLPWNVDNSQLEQVFSEHGKVVDARVVFDRETGRSRGFGFVTMADETEMNDAIAALDGQSLDGRAIRVNVAEERPMRRSF